MNASSWLQSNYRWAIFALALLPSNTSGIDYFKIHVVDADSGRGVPLVELRTVNDVKYYTDSNGLIAFHEPGLVGRDVFFHVQSHGYEHAKDGFGYRGARLRVESGGKATVRIKRINIAERLYRVTGAGVYRDTVLLGEEPPIRQPVLNAQVFGSDSVVNTIYNGKIYWFWGDTNRPSYPLGNFHVPGAISLLPSQGGLSPDVGIDLAYFLDDKGFAKPTCQMPGKGPTWINGLVVVKDEAGRERLFAKYVKVEPPLKIYERGLAEFNDDKQQFEQHTVFDMHAPVHPGGHPFRHTDGGVVYVYFGGQYPLVRVAAESESIAKLAKYQSYTYFKSGSTADNFQLDRDADGNLQLAWRQNTLAPSAPREAKLIREGLLSNDEAYFQLRDVDSKKRVRVHSSSVEWNEFRERWVMIALESFGTSALGEVWFSEAGDPTGPWKWARKVVTHDKYSFYNPKQHPMFAKDGGRVIYFEGTYTSMFSGNPETTPRYNYNQIMYRLDLSDQRLAAELFQPEDR